MIILISALILIVDGSAVVLQVMFKESPTSFGKLLMLYYLFTIGMVT